MPGDHDRVRGSGRVELTNRELKIEAERGRVRQHAGARRRVEERAHPRVRGVDGRTERGGDVTAGRRVTVRQLGKAEPGDIILAINGEEVSNLEDFQRIVAKLKPGQPVKVRYLRDETERETTLTVRGV